MTHEEFNNLYDTGKISVKIYTGVVDGAEKCIEAFSYNGKFYLRLHIVLRYTLDRQAECGKKYRMTKESHFIKEFDCKESANAYFRKAANGLKKIGK